MTFPPACPALAIEGPCCAGKTTLSRALRCRTPDRRLAHIPCYADQAGGGRYLPRPVPTSLPEDAEALERLFRLEEERLADGRRADVVALVMDRCVHTFLSHRFALSRVSGLRLFDAADAIVRGADAPKWPDLVLYLDVPQATIERRNNGKFPPDSIFIDPDYNAGVRRYFSGLLESDPDRVRWIDATAPFEDVAELAAVELDRLLGRGR